jgi:hypothetical protein
MLYREPLQDVVGIDCLPCQPHVTDNHSYFPIFVRAGYPLSWDAMFERIRSQGVFCRRSFYPLISDFPCTEVCPRRCRPACR